MENNIEGETYDPAY